MSTTNNHVCTTDFATSDIVLGFLLCVGIFISFLPQIIVLIFRKNVEGLSVISCWFNYANCMATFLNILFLNWFIFECCHDWMTSWVCFENLLPVVQMAVPFVVTGVIFMLYVIYRPKLPPLESIKQHQQQVKRDGENPASPTLNNDNNNNEVSGEGVDQNVGVVQQKSINSTGDGTTSETSSTGSTNSAGTTPILKNAKKRELAPDSFLLQQGNNRIERLFIRMDWYSQPFFWGTQVATVVFFFIGLALVYGYGSKSGQLEGYAFGLGVVAAILVFFQWMPQIYTTWLANEVGSLSLVSLCIQVPGALLVCYFQLSSGQSWITWFPYLATAVQEAVLVVLCAYYLIRDRKKRKAADIQKKVDEINQINNNVDQIDRIDPLLNSSSAATFNQALKQPTNDTNNNDMISISDSLVSIDSSINSPPHHTSSNQQSIGLNNTDQPYSEYYQSENNQ